MPARAILRAAREGKAEYWVSRTVAELVLGTMIAPRWISNYLARTTVEGQMTSDPISPRRPDNLYTPVARYHRTHGSFGKQAKRRAVTVRRTTPGSGSSSPARPRHWGSASWSAARLNDL